MKKIVIRPDCGNAPRKLFLKDLYTSFVNGKMTLIKANIAEDVSVDIIGKKKIPLKDNFLDSIHHHPTWKAKQLTIETIITHGAEASVSGRSTNAEDLQFSFCDIYLFKSAGATIIISLKRYIVAD